MAISLGSLIDISLRFVYFNQQMMAVHSYHVFELVGTPGAVQYAEAWWNHVKANYRAIVSSQHGPTLISVVVRELNNPNGELAEFDIPTGDQTGTRSPPTANQPLPPQVALSARLTVSTRQTRPGQKRFPFILEEDNNSGQVSTAYKALVQTLLGTLTTNMTLGAPAAGVILTPSVFRRSIDGTVIAHQPVNGYVINPNLSSQNTRKIGRGV